MATTTINHQLLRRALAALAAMATSFLMMLLGPVALPAQAQDTTDTAGTTITVNTIEDEDNTDQDCSLREAIKAANTNQAVDRCPAGSSSGEDSIRFDLGSSTAPPTITLDQALGQLGVTDSAGLVIDGGKEAHVSISGNDAVRVFFVGGGAMLGLKNLTVAPGKDGYAGAGDFNYGGTLRVAKSTFSKNSASHGGGIANFFGAFGRIGSATLGNTIVANSTSGENCFNSSPWNTRTLTDGGYNIDDGTTCSLSASTSKADTDPLLSSRGLRNNGGPTKTIALLSDSPARNAIPKGTDGCATEIKTDQRGVKRPQGANCDIGAFEKKKR